MSPLLDQFTGRKGQEINNLVEHMVEKSVEFSLQGPSTRISILQECMQATVEYFPALVNATTSRRTKAPKNIPDLLSIQTQSWITSPLIWSCWIADLLNVWKSIEKTSLPPKPLSVSRGLNGGYICNVGPYDWTQTLLIMSATCELHLPPGCSLSQSSPLQKSPSVTFILGAGNYEAPIDILSCIFIENSVCIYKFNPLVPEEVRDCVKGLCSPLVNAGLLAFVSADEEASRMFIQHKKVARWVLTGSVKTYNSIIRSLDNNTVTPETSCSSNKSIAKPVRKGSLKRLESIEFTPGSKEPERKKNVIAELGGCTAVVIAPESYSFQELKLHAKHIALFTCFNGTHICVRPQCIITHKQWKQREQFLTLLKDEINNMEAWDCFYPGTKEKWEKFREILRVEGKDDCELEEHTRRSHFPNSLPFLFATGLSLESKTLQEEAFCPVLVEVPLSDEEVLEAVVEKLEKQRDASRLFSNSTVERALSMVGGEKEQRLRERLSAKGILDPCKGVMGRYSEAWRIVPWLLRKGKKGSGEEINRVEDFLSGAGLLVNKHIAGNLACNLVSSGAAGVIGRALDVCIGTLHHGVVAVNLNAVNVLGMATMRWGAGEGLGGSGSGVGYFGNLLGFASFPGAKSVLRASPLSVCLMVQQPGSEEWRNSLFRRVVDAQLRRGSGFWTTIRDVVHVSSMFRIQI